MTPKQKRFVERYLLHLNASKAAEEAGYAAGTAGAQGSRLLQNPAIKEAIDDSAAERSAAAKVEQEKVLRELHTVLNSSIGDYEVDEDGRVRVRPGVPPEAIRAVRSVRWRREYDFDGNLRQETMQLTLWDKPKSLSLALRYLGLLTDRIEVETNANVHLYMPDNRRDAKEDALAAGLKAAVSTQAKTRH